MRKRLEVTGMKMYDLATGWRNDIAGYTVDELYWTESSKQPILKYSTKIGKTEIEKFFGPLPNGVTFTLYGEKRPEPEPEPTCDGKIVEIDGKKYTLKEIK